MRRLRRLLPCLLTAAGHLLTVAWLTSGTWWLALLALSCDALDGAAARRLGACTAFGGLYDWLVDCTTAALIVSRLSPWLLLLLVPLQVLCRVKARRVSGRAALTGVALLWSFW
jgi:phosphatidylglycerophosphate synthase